MSLYNAIVVWEDRAEESKPEETAEKSGAAALAVAAVRIDEGEKKAREEENKAEEAEKRAAKQG